MVKKKGTNLKRVTFLVLDEAGVFYSHISFIKYLLLTRLFFISI